MTGGRCHGPNCTQPDCTACKVYAWMESLPPAPSCEPFKLTREQRDLLRVMYPDRRPDFLRGGVLGDLMGVPIELVDSVEESDWPGPDMRQSGVSTPGCDCGHEGMAASWHLDTCRWVLLRISGPQGVPSAAFPQVAPGEPLDANPQVADNNRRSEVGEPGWLGRAFHWLFGRTT